MLTKENLILAGNAVLAIAFLVAWLMGRIDLPTCLTLIAALGFPSGLSALRAKRAKDGDS